MKALRQPDKNIQLSTVFLLQLGEPRPIVSVLKPLPLATTTTPPEAALTQDIPGESQ
jgi:hypothetical protein